MHGLQVRASGGRVNFIMNTYLLKKYIFTLFLLYVIANVLGFLIPFSQILQDLDHNFPLLPTFDILASVLVLILVLNDREIFNISGWLLIMLLFIILIDRNIGMCLIMITTLASSTD